VLDAVSPRAGQLGELLERENAALVRRVLHELGNERDRQILLRFYIAEEDKERLSEDFGLSSLQFNRVLHRARQRYKELLVARLAEAGARERIALLVLLAAAGAMFRLLVPLSEGMLRRP
jgi:DNA-directed RNA polymerase specialized sigma24 family protein